MTEWRPDVVVYHDPCDDGFASAWVAARKWPDVELVGCNYGLPLKAAIAGKNVLIADFSFKPEVLRELGARAASIVILDHHKTAQADLADFTVTLCGTARFVVGDTAGVIRDLVELGRPPIVAHFDMERSGSRMTWDFCFADEPPAPLIAFVEDRDLWRFALPDTRKVSLMLRSFPYDLEAWDAIAVALAGSRDAFMAQAAAIERYYDRRLAEMLPTATLRKIGRWEGVPVAHASSAFASDLANELLKKHPEAPFAAVVVDAYGGRTWSLRSEDSRQDVSEVAAQFGGGGHRNAAGFRTPL